VPQRDGPFDGDQGADEAQHHQHPVHIGQPVEPHRGGDSEQDQCGIEPRQQCDPGGRQQRHTDQD
jgi:hypothetical protein